MGVSIIDGTITEAVPGRKAMNVRQFRRIDFRLADGSPHSLNKPMVHADLADRIQPGASGRFYLFSCYDHRGVAGYRDERGEALFRFPRNNEIILAAVMVPVALWVFYALFFLFGLPIFWTILLVFGVASLIHYHNVRLQAERQFAADNSRASATANPVGGTAAGR